MVWFFLMFREESSFSFELDFKFNLKRKFLVQTVALFLTCFQKLLETLNFHHPEPIFVVLSCHKRDPVASQRESFKFYSKGFTSFDFRVSLCYKLPHNITSSPLPYIKKP